jgi:hypothetical protein
MHEAAAGSGSAGVEVEAMVKRGTVRSVVAGWTTVVLSSEVEGVLSRRVSADD